MKPILILKIIFVFSIQILEAQYNNYPEVGSVSILDYSPLLILQRNTSIGGYIQGVQTRLNDGTDNWFSGNAGTGRWVVSKGSYANDKIAILDNGNVGIGTSNPEDLLHIIGSDEHSLRYYRNVGSCKEWGIGSDNYGTYFHNITEGIIPLFIGNGNGNIGIGTTFPQYLLSSEKSFTGGTVGMYVKNTGGTSPQTLTRFAVGMTPGETSALLIQYDHNSDEAIVFNRKSASGTLDLLTTGGGIRIFNNGNVGIGVSVQNNYKLNVSGVIRANEVIVNSEGADFVFEPGYKLADICEIEKYIKENKHLPDIAPASDMQQNGVKLSEIQTKLLQKIEELTLYLINQNKRIESLENEIQSLREELRR